MKELFKLLKKISNRISNSGSGFIQAMFWLSVCTATFIQYSHSEEPGSFEQYCHPGFHTDFQFKESQASELDQHCDQAVSGLFGWFESPGTTVNFQADFIDRSALLFGRPPVLRTEPTTVKTRTEGIEALLELQELSQYLAEVYGVEITVQELSRRQLHKLKIFTHTSPIARWTLLIPGSINIKDILIKELHKTSNVAMNRSFFNSSASEREFARIIKLISLLQPLSTPHQNQLAITLMITRIRQALSLPTIYASNIPDLLGLSTRTITDFLSQYGTDRNKIDTYLRGVQLTTKLSDITDNDFQLLKQTYEKIREEPASDDNHQQMWDEYQRLGSLCASESMAHCQNISLREKYEFYMLKSVLYVM